MKKLSVLLIALVLSSHAYADRNPDNLKGFLVKDICPFGTIVYIDGVESEVDTKRGKQILNDLDILFNLGFSNVKNYSTCTQSGLVIFEALKTNIGAYVYTVELNISSKLIITQRYDGPTTVKHASFYDTGAFGIVTDLASLREVMDKGFRDRFEEFVLDWRKIH